jgi:precorrin-6B methylase 2
MVNEQVNSAMVQLAGIQPGDLILEIGPGTGSLTKFLVEAGAHIIAVEKVLYYIALPTQNQSAILTCSPSSTTPPYPWDVTTMVSNTGWNA